MLELINQSNRSLVYKDSNELSEGAIWKICSYSKNTVSDLVNEFTITQQLNIPGVRKPLQKGVYENKEAFSYRYFEGAPLKEYIQDARFDLEKFLRISIAITRILKDLHQAGFSHLRINSNNILYNAKSGAIEIIDFSLSAKGLLRRYLNFKDCEHELSYIAPEQTGRLNQVVDHRTDLYSLGIVFYEMLTGKLPFSNSDSAMLVHMHLVQIPVPAIYVNKNIPLVISQIIDKLLCKNPEERYQTAYGLEYDLVACAQTYNRKEQLVPFQLAVFDRSNQFNLSSKIFGRDNEINEILRSLDNITRDGSVLCLVSGGVGTGKTTFVNHFKKIILEKEGIMVTGRFDRLSNNVPHSAMVNALKELAAIILSQPDKAMAEWKSVLKKAIAENQELLFEIVPEFKWIIDDENLVPEADKSSLRKRMNFNTIFRKIVEAAASVQRFFVLFIDDLQWSDSASIKTIHSLITDPNLNHFMMICTYRPGELQNENTVHQDIDELRTLKPGLVELRMNDLTRQDIHAFIDHSFLTDDSEKLSYVIHNKTLGNPFFIHQFLTSVVEKGILSFNAELQNWIWDTAKLDQVYITDNVVQFVTERVKGLPTATQEVLKHASCIGVRFTSNMLSDILAKPAHSLADTLERLTNENILEFEGDETYKFPHERIRQTVYDMIAAEEKSRIHYLIASKLSLEDINQYSSAALYEIAGHFNAAKDHIPVKDMQAVAQINFRAGLEAKRSAAFDLSYNYLDTAIGLVKASDWDDHYTMVLNLHNEATEVAFILGKQAAAESLLTASTTNAKTIGDRVKAHEIKLNHLSENHHFPEAIDHLLKVLSEIGYGIKRHPGKFTLLKEYALVKWYLRNKNINDIPEEPLMENERAYIFMRLTVNSLISIFGAAPDILPIVIFRQVQLSLRYGNSLYAPFAYSFYGFALCTFMGDVQKGYKFGKMALLLIQKLNAELVKAKVMVIFYGFLSYWIDSLRLSVLPLGEAYLTGRQTGDFVYAAFALSFQSSIRLHAGDHLPELLEVMTSDCETIKSMNQDLVYNISESQRQFVINLTNEVKDPLILNNEAFDESEFLRTLEKTNDEASKFDFYYYKMALASTFNEYEVAFKNSQLASAYEEETTSRQITYPSFILHSSIAVLKQVKNISSIGNKKGLIKKVLSKMKLLKEFSKHASQNFENKYSLLQALLFEFKGQPDNASEYFYKSIQQAQKNNFVHEEALAREHLCYLYFKTGKNEYAEFMLKSAYRCYQKWGAFSKCHQLLQKFPEIFADQPVKGDVLNISSFQNIYDLNTIISLNQALSVETTLEGLLKTMLEIVIQNASVNNAVIILKSKDDQFIPLAIGNNEQITILGPDVKEQLFPVSVVNYVTRTKAIFVSNNFLQEERFAFDVYNKTHSAISVCAIPLIIKSDVTGVLYLENNLAEGAFDNRRVEFYKTISSQLAISLDNVFLYKEMDQKIKDRTSELNTKNAELTIEKKKSDDLLLNILPLEIANELKNFGKTSARHYDNVTILFTDIRNFSVIAGTLHPEELVSELDFVFKKFDHICTKFNLEKIKTIGDAYMAAGGLSEINKTPVKNAIKASIEMQEFMRDLSQQRKQQGRQFFEIRVGIHTGPVIAGVVGHSKFQYDIWGDTVNIAARMEQNSEAGKINISQATYNFVKESYRCTHRGKIRAKNIGEVDMYFVEDSL